MTVRRTGRDGHDDAGAKAPAESAAKGSVHEAIGKLIGDDAVRKAGAAEREAGANDAPRPGKSPRR